MKPGITFLYRQPEYSDLNALLEIEQLAFSSDRLSRRRMRHWMTADSRSFLVCQANPEGKKAIVAGYILLFYRKNNATARLYSIAVAEQFRGHGIGRQLIIHGEQQVRSDGRSRIQLEVRPDNRAAITLYESLGYHQYGLHREFYEDGTDALLFRKSLFQK